MPLFIDLPRGTITDLAFSVCGWVATDAWDAQIAIKVNGRHVPFSLHDRPDVRAVEDLSRFSFTSGVNATVALEAAPTSRQVVVELICDYEREIKRFEFDMYPVIPELSAAADLRSWSKQWCKRHLRCPACHQADASLNESSGAITCSNCRTEFIQNSTALNLISPELKALANLSPSTNVSLNPYTPDAWSLIREATINGGCVLDCGAGARPERIANVINLEIVDYPSTDVLAVGEALPFADNCFDGVLSLAVLEHVRDPFLCAREIMRVLKPGGQILADVPFLQPVHGYPNHYYNMTQQGLINLFSGLGEVIECKVPPHGHPIFGVQWLLSQYLLGLPNEERDWFSQLTIGETANLAPHQFLAMPAASKLDVEAQSIIGCLNSLRLRKI